MSKHSTDGSDQQSHRPAMVDHAATTEGWQVSQIEAGLRAAKAGDFASEDDVTRLREKYSQR